MNESIIGLCRWQWLPLRDNTQLYGHAFHVHPNWRSFGIRRSLLRYCETMLCALATEHQQAQLYSAQSRRLFAFLPMVQNSEVTLEELLVQESYWPVRFFFEMVPPNLDNLTTALLPQGVDVRPVHRDQYHAIYAAHKETFEDHCGSTPSSEQDYQNWLVRNPCPHLWQVAWEGDQIAGMVLTAIGVEQNRAAQQGYCDPISVCQAWRQRGLARALLMHSLHVLKEQGMREAGLMVDTANTSGALRLYESAGFRVVKRSTIYDKLMWWHAASTSFQELLDETYTE